MTPTDEEIAASLEEFADLLAAKDVDYKPRAYRRAAENVRHHGESVVDLAADGDAAVKEVEGVGDAIAGKIVEYVETGTIEELAELREELPVEIDELTRVEGVGPKTVGTLYEELGVQTLEELATAAEDGEIQEVSGFGAKTEQNISENIAFAREAAKRELLGEGRPRGEAVVEYLSKQSIVERVTLAGSIRRWRPTVGDVDVLVGSDDTGAAVDAFTDWPAADTVIQAGDQKASVRAGGVQVDLRVVVPGEFGAALQYFTGSKDHNVTLRNRAIERGLKMNEYGVFDIGDAENAVDGEHESGDDAEGSNADQRAGRRVAGETEEGMYATLDLPWMAPELRENRGEIEAAVDESLPDLVPEDAIRGDLHVHTEWSDGDTTIEEMVASAAAFGHDYVGITDHATGPGMVGGVGVSDDALHDQLAEIRAVADRAAIDVFAGVEANVAMDGAVSIDDDLLAELDLVVASPHAGLDGDGTDRLVDAARHPAVDVIGHPTGRYLNRRTGLEVDVERLASVAADTDTALEINANPARLDLNGRAVKTAIEAGATIAINTDAHRPGRYDVVRYGVHTARRGWAEADDVLNARDAEGVTEFLS
jgi:DNA polymerase (family 10)